MFDGLTETKKNNLVTVPIPHYSWKTIPESPLQQHLQAMNQTSFRHIIREFNHSWRYQICNNERHTQKEPNVAKLISNEISNSKILFLIITHFSKYQHLRNR